MKNTPNLRSLSWNMETQVKILRWTQTHDHECLICEKVIHDVDSVILDHFKESHPNIFRMLALNNYEFTMELRVGGGWIEVPYQFMFDSYGIADIYMIRRLQ